MIAVSVLQLLEHVFAVIGVIAAVVVAWLYLGQRGQSVGPF